MKNLKKKKKKRHNSLRRKIKTLNKQIPEKENKLKELESKYPNKKGRSKKEDKKRQKNIDDKRKLKQEISELKARRRKYRKILKDDKKYIKRISLIFKSKLYKTVWNRFNKLYAIRKEMSEEIKKYLENLKDLLDVALHYTLNKNVPSTNNLIEQYYKISFGCNL